MKSRVHLAQRVILFFFLMSATATAIVAQNNSINGMVFDSRERRPVSDLYVELMNEVGSTLRRVRVDSSGRFVFTGLSAGTFAVRVLTYGTNYKEETQEATLVSLSRRGSFSSDRVYLEFYLKLDPSKINTGVTGTTPGAVFVQEIPNEARKLYRKAVEQLGDKKDAGLESLRQAIEIFPTYYEALDLLGNEYVRRNQYSEAAPYLIRAIDVNQRSFTSFYALGIACYRLREMKAASEALRAATVINPQSINAQAWYGIVLRISKDYEKAEKALLQAKSLSQKSVPVAEIHWQLALLYEKTERYGQAADELEQYLKIEPKVPNAEKIKKLITQLRARAK